MLPVLKEAGVVDSGGQGLLQVTEGCIMMAFLGKEVDYDSEMQAPAGGETKPDAELKEQVPADIRYGYCTEFIILLEKEYTMRRLSWRSRHIWSQSAIRLWSFPMTVL